MKNTELIKKLRGQVIDDSAGRVCCRSGPLAEDFFKLAVESGQVAKPEAQLFNEITERLWDLDSGKSYEKWDRLFGLVESGTQGNSIAPAGRSILRQRGREALRTWEAAKLKDALNLLVSRPELWGQEAPDPGEEIREVAGQMQLRLELSPPEAGAAENFEACLRTVSEIFCQAAAAAKAARPMTRAVKGWLEQGPGAPADSAADLVHTANLVLCLLQHGHDLQVGTDRLFEMFRALIPSRAARPDALARTLNQARMFFTALGSAAHYEMLYRSALPMLVGGDSALGPDAFRRLAETHPAPGQLVRFLELAWDREAAGFRPKTTPGADAPAWRELVIGLCRENEDEKRQPLFRAWTLQQVKPLLTDNPDKISRLVTLARDLLPLPFPDHAQLEELIAHAAGLQYLSPRHVQAIIDLVNDARTKEGARQWCSVYDTMTRHLELADRRQWLLVLLDLTRVSLNLDEPKALAEGTLGANLVQRFIGVLQSQDGQVDDLSAILAMAARLLESVGLADHYPQLYQAAVEAIAAATSLTVLGPETATLLAETNPRPDGLKAMLELLWDARGLGLRPVSPNDADDPGWRLLIFNLCQEPKPENHKARLRAWIIQRIKALVEIRPEDALRLRDEGRPHCGQPFPDQTEVGEISLHVAALKDFTVIQVRAVARLAVDAETVQSVNLWCDLYESLDEPLRTADKREWLSIGLDLLRVSLKWESEAAARATTRIRNFCQLVMVSHPAYRQAAERILRCESEILNGALLRNALRSFPKPDTAAIAELKAAGLGLGLTEREILGH